MLSHLLATIHEARYPALGIWADHFYANDIALQLLGREQQTEAYEVIRREAEEARKSRTIRTFRVADEELRAMPVPSVDDRSDAVFIGRFAAEEIPKIFADLAGGASPWPALVAIVPGIILTVRPDGRIDYTNRHWREYTGDKSFPSLSGLTARLAPEDNEVFIAAWRDGIAKRVPFTIHARLQRHDGVYRWNRFSAQPLVRAENIVKWIALVSDVHDEIEARNEADRANARLRFLFEAGRRLHSSFDPLRVAKIACDVAVEGIASSAALDFSLFGATHRVRVPATAVMSGAADSLLGNLAEQRIMIWSGTAEFPWYVSILLQTRGGPIGRLALGLSSATPPSEEVDLIEQFGERVALALENACMYENERRIANTLQAELLPAKLDEPYGLHVDAVYLPCEDEARVGGDWYDSFELPDGRLTLTIGDVTGHGIAAAAMMGKLRQTIRAAMYGGAGPAKALSLANDLVCGEEPELTTAIVAIFDPFEHTLRWSAAGHLPPLLLTDSGVEFLEDHGPALGVFDAVELPEFTRALPERGGIVLYTDGLVEYDQNFVTGMERLREVLAPQTADCMTLNARNIVRDVLGASPHIDDAALLLLCFEPLREIDMMLPALPSQSQVARRTLMRFARTWGLERARANDLVLASCEALNNAIEHAYERTKLPVQLLARRIDNELVVTVKDSGHWSIHPPREDRGRGLQVIGALADGVRICRAEDGTSVRVEFKTPVYS